MSDWYNSFSYIGKKIDVNVNRKIDMNVKYTANAIQDLCEMRDLPNFELFDNTKTIYSIFVYYMIYMYSIHIRNADIVLICVYIYSIYTVFVVDNCFLCIILIVNLNIILVYYQFYLLCTNKDYYYCLLDLNCGECNVIS